MEKAREWQPAQLRSQKYPAPLLLIIGWRTEWSGIIKIQPASGRRAVAERSGAGPEPSRDEHESIILLHSGHVGARPPPVIETTYDSHGGLANQPKGLCHTRLTCFRGKPYQAGLQSLHGQNHCTAHST